MDGNNNDVGESYNLFASFEKECTALISKNVSLEEQLRLVLLNKEEMEIEAQNRLEEIYDLKISLNKIQSALRDNYRQQEENYKFREEIKNAKIQLEEINRKFEKEKKNWQDNENRFKNVHSTEIESLLKADEIKISEMNDQKIGEISEKDQQIKNLKEKLLESEKASNEEVTRVKLDYEARLMKTMRQNSLGASNNLPHSAFTTTTNNSNNNNNNNSDIYRRKLQHVQQTHEREITSLNRKITELQQKMNSNHYK